MTFERLSRYFDISDLICSILGGLVAITAGCSVFGPGESLLIGFIGGVLAIGGTRLLIWCRVDDPVGAFPVHGIVAVWGVLAVGIFGYEISSVKN